MSISLRNNVVSKMGANHLNQSARSLSHTLERISSGSRIKRIGDDAAGAAVGVNLSARATSGAQAIRNSNDGISLLQTSLAALNETENLLSRLRELTVQSASDTLKNTERKYIFTEYKQVANEISRLSDASEFNGLDVGTGESYAVQVGVDGDDNNQIELTTANIETIHGIVEALNFTTSTLSQASIQLVDSAIDEINQQQSRIGAKHNRLVNAINNQEASVLSHQGSASRIQDADMAMETSRMTALQVKHSASIAALGQANGMSQAVLSLI